MAGAGVAAMGGVSLSCAVNEFCWACSCGGFRSVLGTFLAYVGAVALVCNGDMLKQLGVLVASVPRYVAGALPVFTNRFIFAACAYDLGEA